MVRASEHGSSSRASHFIPALSSPSRVSNRTSRNSSRPAILNRYSRRNNHPNDPYCPTTYQKQALFDSSFLELYEQSVAKARLRRPLPAAESTTRAPEEKPVVSPLKVEFQFDFGSPNAYLAELALPAIERRTGVKFEYVPVLLGGIYKATNNMSPAESLARDQEQAGVPGAGNPALHSPPQHHKVPVKSVFPGQHADADAGRRRGPVRRHVRAVFPRRLPSHVGRAEEDGRCRGLQ